MAKGKETPTGRKEQQGRGGGDRGSTAARPTLTRDWGGPQVRDPVPVVSVNPEADPPQPRAPVRPNRAEQDGETAEEKSHEHKKNVKSHPESQKAWVSRRIEAGRSQAQGAPQRMNVHGEVMYAKHVTREKVTWENNRKNGALKSGVENASKKRKAGAGRGFHGNFI